MEKREMKHTHTERERERAWVNRGTKDRKREE
jgi:hypothetical protein